MTPVPDAIERFSSRVSDYVKYRPSYPGALCAFLSRELGVHEGAVVADIGSGTGIFARPLLEAGCVVHCVEPNREMREAAERLLGAMSGFRSVSGTAEATTLRDASVDLATAAQAFHWFDPEKAAAEFGRILRPGGRAALVWNTRVTRGTPFLEAYERLLAEFGTDYAAVRHDRGEQDRLRRFFGGEFERRTFANAQRLDLEGLRCRLLSASYTPAADDPRRLAMLDAVERLFRRHEQGGAVVIDYETELYWGMPLATGPRPFSLQNVQEARPAR